MRPRNCLIFTFGFVEMERIVFGNKPPTVLSHVLRLRWLGTNWRGLAGAVDVLRWWISHLNSFENVFTVLVLPRSDGDYSGIHPWCDLTTQSLDKTQNYKICILSLSVPLAWLLIYSAESEWSLIWIFLSGFQQIFSHDTKIFKDHKCIIASFNG